MSQMECCVGVSIETVLQVVKFYTVVNEKKIKETDVSDCSPSLEWIKTIIRKSSIMFVTKSPYLCPTIKGFIQFTFLVFSSDFPQSLVYLALTDWTLLACNKLKFNIFMQKNILSLTFKKCLTTFYDFLVQKTELLYLVCESESAVFTVA